MRSEEFEQTGRTESSTEIQAEIEQTRAQLGTKIDTIQERLDPERLKLQAQDVAKDILHEAQGSAKQVIQEAGSSMAEYVDESIHSMSTYVQEHREEISHSVARTVKQNPLPAALVGVGLGWLLFSAMSGGDQSAQRRRERQRRRFQDHDSWERDVLYREGRESSLYPPSAGYDSNRMRSGEPGAGGWRTGPYNESASGQELYRGPDHDRNRRQHDRPGMGERMQDKGQEAMHRTQEMGADIKHRFEETGSDIADRTQEMGREVTDRLRETGEEVMHRTQEMGHEAYERAEEGLHYMSEEVGRRGTEFGRQMHRRSREMGHQLQDNLEDNPLTFGLMAFAAGAALAMLLPQTRAENRMMGEYRDEMMDSARDAAESAMHHAQNVYEEVRPELEEGVERFRSEMREVGDTAKEEMRGVAEKAKASAQEESRATIQEVGGQQSDQHSAGHQQSSTQSTGSTPMNKDTFKGRWNQLKGDVKQKWGKLTDDDITRIEGDYDKLIGRVQERYGYSRERAEQEAGQFLGQSSKK